MGLQHLFYFVNTSRANALCVLQTNLSSLIKHNPTNLPNEELLPKSRQLTEDTAKQTKGIM
jgi:hypothetical protein